MKKNRKLVFLTGATGMMGRYALKHFLKLNDQFKMRILVRPSRKNRLKMFVYYFNRNVKIVWGDLTDKEDLLYCVAGADYVLHLGAMVSPQADKYPKATIRINLGATNMLIDAIKAQPNADDIALVYIGTVGQTGGRTTPIHWGRCGDPIKGAMLDTYTTSKIAAERAVFESGLKKWVSIRQTGMLPFRMSAILQPIIFHQNANNVIEWATAEESAVLLAGICSDDVPDSFWRKCYNIGGGEKWRFTYWEFMNMTLKLIGVTFDQFFDAQDLALYNFHGMWYTDSDALNDIIPFRIEDPQVYMKKFNAKIAFFCNNPLVSWIVSSTSILHKIGKRVAKKHMGPQWMIDNNEEDWIKAFFGSRTKKDAIKSWEEGNELLIPSKEKTYLNHGYDERKGDENLAIDDMRGAAVFRGGECLSETMKKGDLLTPIHWRCAFGHEFDATPNLVLRGGHWCPQCERESWNFAEQAKVNPFFAQVWTPIHGNDDAVVIKKEYNDLSV